MGVFIFAKGVYFGGHARDVQVMVKDTPFDLAGNFVVHYIAMAHIFGGMLIALGLITRVAILFQLPILLGAVLWVRSVNSFSFYSNEAQALITLVLCCLFLVYGSGKLSVDEFMRRHPDS